VIDELGQSYSGAENRYKQAESLQETESIIQKLKVELAWAHVAEKGTEYEKAAEETASAKSRLQKVQQKIEEAQKTVADAEERVNSLQARAIQAVAPDALQAQFNNLQADIRTRKDEAKKSIV
jgi:chromosome segregation ATPase